MAIDQKLCELIDTDGMTIHWVTYAALLPNEVDEWQGQDGLYQSRYDVERVISADKSEYITHSNT